MKLSKVIKRSYKRAIFNLSASNNLFFLAFYTWFYRPAKGSFSEFTDQFSKKYSPITVIQIGANDGFNHDPIHKFIKRDKWHGVLVEPQVDVFNEFLKKLHLKSPHIHTLNAAIDYSDGLKPFYKISFTKNRWATGLASFDRSVVEKAYTSGHVERMAKKEGLTMPDSIDQGIEEIQIPALSPKSLIEKYQLGHVHWLQIDTEGFDFEVIKMFEIDTLQPEVIVYEHSHLSESDKNDCLSHLKNSGYQTLSHGGNTLAVRKTIANQFPIFN